MAKYHFSNGEITVEQGVYSVLDDTARRRDSDLGVLILIPIVSGDATINPLHTSKKGQPDHDADQE